MTYFKKILITILITFLTQTVLGSTWSTAYPYKQKIEGQDVVVKAIPYAPYSGSPMIGLTKVYFKNKLLYTINKYYREKIFTSNDGQYLIIVRTSNSVGVSSYTSFGKEQINYDQTAIEVLKNGLPFKKFTLKNVIDTTKLENNGHFFYWGYDFDLEAFEKAEKGCKICKNIYGKRVLRNGDTTKIFHDEWLKYKNQCDSVRLKKIEMKVFKNSIFVKENSLFILTNQNTVVTLNLKDFTIQQIPFDKIITNKESFNPPKTNRKYRKVKLPDKFDEPNLKDGRSLKKGIGDLFGLTVPPLEEKENFSVFIENLLINKDGKCVNFFANVYDKRISEFYTTESINREMTEKLNKWIKEQTFDTKLIPKGFENFSFTCITQLK